MTEIGSARDCMAPRQRISRKENIMSAHEAGHGRLIMVESSFEGSFEGDVRRQTFYRGVLGMLIY